MRITHIELISASNDLFCTLGFQDAKNLNPYVMKSVDGLDAPDILPKFYALGEESKQKYWNMTVVSRQIVLRIGLNPDYVALQTFSSLRDMLYKNIVSTRSGYVQVIFKDGPGTEGVQGVLFGQVVKFETALAETPEVQITLNCLNPMIRGNSIVLPTPAVEEDNSLILNDDISTAPHGFSFKIRMLEGATYVGIHDDFNYGEWQFSIRPWFIEEVEGFLEDDILHVKGQPGVITNLAKSVTLERDGEFIPIADRVEQGSLWPIIFPGQNQFILEGPGTYEWLEVEWSPEFWGI